ncbi:Hypothetical predicted protein [Mytilus galloprovincialis]|uniref:Reverse transcriptase RNase H-like domain-containing protein n=1 Tax=Mytilus galloprovincialis TaxID=29158 RepID=A0A8B6H4J0_MYTGA|nr:Hypothetical predicted protein [Mytilus galloprovincialis]
MYLDDGLGGADNYDECTKVSHRIRADLIDFGFIIAEEKCNWNPVQVIIFLGMVWDTSEGRIRITDERINRILKCISCICNRLPDKRVISVKLLASVVGQLISTQGVLGTTVRLRTRYAYDCVQDRTSWEAPVWVTPEAEVELEFWLSNIVVRLNADGALFSQLTNEACDVNMFSDASGEGYGGYIAEAGNSKMVEMFGAWDAHETNMSSTWRELEAVHRVLKTNLPTLNGQSVKIHTDNKNVETILKVGSKKTHLQDINMEIQNACEQSNVSFFAQWIPRENNTHADTLSRLNDCDDWGVQTWLFRMLDREWGSHTVDRFAASYNKKCDKFNSKFWCQGTSGVDAFKQHWGKENNWLVHLLR